MIKQTLKVIPTACPESIRISVKTKGITVLLCHHRVSSVQALMPADCVAGIRDVLVAVGLMQHWIFQLYSS
ncbi:hypothetical protein G5B00_14470 [Parapedobacter sp. SGR-10]|uniref:hypothetical protein n=1 Tax=Parapedobacter sp. SGR-10 TaxID=2710879 RepID=UPI0013D2C6AB|nr:hypothetical protein [Parapedobacter sp. SGR-10]NGF57720.1 hypothetical protein [Parapedobacter sp. SGR-10]